MCGIAGVVGKNIANKVDLVRLMLETQRHRGPDRTNFIEKDKIIIGHNRLSIIDLSNNADQPMTSLNGRFIVSFNGEIYNYLELKKQFFEDIYCQNWGDTRLLVELFSIQNIRCLNYLRGMFSIVIWDNKKKQLILIRDRFGIKPLYYFQKKKNFFFSSEIKPLLHCTDSRLVNYDVAQEYLEKGLIDNTKNTFFKNIYQLLPGQCMIVNAEGEIIKSFFWYNLFDKIQPFQKNKFDHNQFKDKLQNSINIHLRSDVRLGIAISGGVDSTVLACAINNLGMIEETKGYNFYYKNKKYSEKKFTEAISDKIKLKTSYIIQESLNIFKKIKEQINTQEQPFGGLATISMNAIYQHAKNDGLKVLLSGCGADDYLAGSNREILFYLFEIYKKNKNSFSKTLSSFSKNLSISEYNIIKIMNNFDKKNENLSADGTKGLMLDVLKNKTDYKTDISYKQKELGHFKYDLYERMTVNKLPRSLRYEDRNSMSHSIETRVPFLDHHLVEYCLNLPSQYLVNNGIGKIILRDYLKKTIFKKSSMLTKRSVQTPQTEWLTNTAGKKYINGILNHHSILSEFLDIKSAKELINSNNKNITNSNYLWQWINIHSRYKNFF